MDPGLAAGLLSVRFLAAVAFYIAAGLRLGAPGHFPIARAIAAAALAAGAGMAGPPLIAWPLFAASLAGSLLAFYRPAPAWAAGAVVLGLASDGAIHLACSIAA